MWQGGRGTDRQDLLRITDGGMWQRQTASANGEDRCIMRTFILWGGMTQPTNYVWSRNYDNQDGLYNRPAVFIGRARDNLAQKAGACFLAVLSSWPSFLLCVQSCTCCLL